ncbi:MAG: hypothetical protein MUF03_00655 [Rubrivivax sp.]|jgi:hypothetical protein|nr:hypothetical protein [Rubrivivax sp.]
MNALQQAAAILAAGLALSTAQATTTIVVEAPRVEVDPAALIGEDSGSFLLSRQRAGPGVERAAVVAELDRARASGELGVWIGEDSGSFHLSARDGGTRTAASGAATLASARPD